MEAVTDAGIPQEDEQVIIDTVAVGTAASVTDLDSTPPTSAEKQLVGMDPEVTRMYDRHSTASQTLIIRMCSKNRQMCCSFSRFETKCSELLSWVKTQKTSARMLASADPESSPGSSDLLADFKVRLKELI